MNACETREMFVGTATQRGTSFMKLKKTIKKVVRDVDYSDLYDVYSIHFFRLSIYGRNINEWDKLADWTINNNVYSGMFWVQTTYVNVIQPRYYYKNSQFIGINNDF